MRSVSSAMATGICLLVAGAVAADDIPLVGFGGSYRPMRGEPPVRLESVGTSELLLFEGQ